MYLRTHYFEIFQIFLKKFFFFTIFYNNLSLIILMTAYIFNFIFQNRIPIFLSILKHKNLNEKLFIL